MKANKYVCIHGHFYQPPRENAWLGVVELQDSAEPFHDWNDRINFECYAPNTAARILDQKGEIVNIINNYSRISFNFGPTLLSWMQEADERTYQSILDADRRSQEHFNGHGAALAQVYNHMIMPLANQKDKETQIIWGIEDFKSRFGRMPEGIWLAETAVDTPTLEILADNGIKFTILAPRQGKAIRRLGDKEWINLPPDSIDPRHPYLYKLPSGKEIVLFFYHGGIAQGVAFNGYLNNGDFFASRFFEVFDNNEEPQLAHIATDGESYGHHHTHGEMALASCLKQIEHSRDAQLTNYGQYLELFPPTYEAQIHENSSWSCVHGVERWRNNCGCNSGMHPGWTQDWRRPLRLTLDWLREELIPIYESEGEELLHHPWEARNEYIQVILNRDDETVDKFLRKHAKANISQSQKTKVLRLMEMQRNAMLMYTSCGWFFDEISGIETDQILQYANRAIHYAAQVADIHLHDAFLRKLKEAPSNVYRDGAGSYQKNVMPARVDLVRMGMHYAASSLFEEYPQQLELFNYIANSHVFHRRQAGLQKLVVGQTQVKSKTTYSEKHFSFAVLYLGQQNMIGNISVNMKQETFEEMADALITAFETTNLGDVIGLMQRYFGPDKFTIWHLFRDEKRKILKEITGQSLASITNTFRDFYNDNYQLMTGIRMSGIPVPGHFLNVVRLILNADLRTYFQIGNLNVSELRRLSGEFSKWEIAFTEQESLKLDASERIYLELQRILAEGFDATDKIRNLNAILRELQHMRIEVNFWKSQNLFFSMLRTYRKLPNREKFKEWQVAFYNLGQLLGVNTWE